MKTLEEFIKEIESSEALLNEIKTITSDDEFAAFLKKHDCGASVKEYLDYVASANEGEIGDDEAEAASGGYPGGYPTPPHAIKDSFPVV